MAYGGGTWHTQDKRLPGTYINITSLSAAGGLASDGGIVAIPLVLNWGPEQQVFSLKAEEFETKSMILLGCDSRVDALCGLREVFKHAGMALCYRLGKGSTKAECAIATARYGGTLGNQLSLSVSSVVDDETLWEVKTYFRGVQVDMQRVSKDSVPADNAYVQFKPSVTLTAAVGMPLKGGAQATSITVEDHQDFLDHIEAYSFHALCCPTVSEQVMKIYEAFTRRMRDERGCKFQTACFRSSADYEGVVSVWNESTSPVPNEHHQLLYWVAGALAGAQAGASLTNMTYDGELTVDVALTQGQLEQVLQAGHFAFHRAGDQVRVLEDVNSLVTLTSEKGSLFQNNQTIRLADKIATEVAILFNTRYHGRVKNEAAGRDALWNDVIKLLEEFRQQHAIEAFEADQVVVEAGEGKTSVVLRLNGLTLVHSMNRLYMNIVMQ